MKWALIRYNRLREEIEIDYEEGAITSEEYEQKMNKLDTDFEDYCEQKANEAKERDLYP